MNPQELHIDNTLPVSKINKYLPVAILYFFLNSFLLPLGLLYTTLLTPVFLIWLSRYRTIRTLWIFFLFIVPFAVVHFYHGVDYWYYFKSLALFFSVFVFCMAFYQFLENCRSLRTLYKNILLINGFMVIVSLLFLFVPFLQPIFWFNDTMSISNIQIPRMRMLTYEPSYYCTLFAPLVIYYLLKVFRKELPRPARYVALTVIPLFLSLSFGVILGISISFLALLLLNSRRTLLHPKNIKYTIGIPCLLLLGLVFLLIFFPDNIFFRRIAVALAGKDTSFNGRTLDSFILSTDIAGKKSLFWGAGLGQAKVLGLEDFRIYYHYNKFTESDIGIPNSIGDIISVFGLFGATLKICLEGWFYFKTRVYSNYYRMTLFLFVFIYQFTGSYIMNIAEYAIWILAFKEGLFPEFDKKRSPTPSIPPARSSSSSPSSSPARSNSSSTSNSTTP